MSNTINNANEVQIINNNGQLVVSSRQVAESFGKEHGKVLRSIHEIMSESGEPILACEMFYETTYENRGKQYPEYLMNGISLGYKGHRKETCRCLFYCQILIGTQEERIVPFWFCLFKIQI